MYYVIIDPGLDYPLHMIHFLGQHGLKAIAVFTSPHEYHAYRTFFGPMLAPHVADEYLATQFPSVEALADQIRHDVHGEIHGIIPWAEMTIEFGALLGDRLELDWNPPEVIHRFRNKYAMKQTLRERSDVRVNASSIVSSMDEVFQFQERLGRWPIVVKPTEGAGSRAVYFAEDWQELHDATIDVFHSGAGEVLLEEFIGGVEHVVNGVTDSHGRMLVTDVWRYDKRDVGPHKNLYHQTIKVNTGDPVWRPLAVYATEVVHTLGLRKAPVHMELKIDAYGPCLIEVGARFAGGNQPLLASEAHGRSLFELAACHYLSDGTVSWDDVNYEQYNRRQARIVSGVQTHAIRRISEVVGVEEVSRLPSFYGFGKLLGPGASAEVTTDLMSRPYEVYLLNGDEEQIEYDARRVRELLYYR